MRARITGAGHFLPSRVVTNDDLSKLMPTTDEWIHQRTGIKERRFIEHDGIGASDLAVPAAKIPIGISESWKSGAIKAGSTVLMAAFGAGFTWGSAIVRF